MKKILIAISLLLSVAACSSDQSETAKKEQTSGKEILPVIKGTWVMTDYIRELEVTRSPKAASGKLQGIVSMTIDPTGMTGDTLVISSSLNNHEGYTFYLFMRQGQDDKSLATGHTDNDNSGAFYELSYSVRGGDTSVVLNHYDKNKQLLDARNFTKVTGPQSENSQPYDLQYMANKVLLAGTYTATDEQGKTTTVTLTDDGLVTGVGTHTTYYIFTDFMGDTETNLDEMLFDEHTKTQKPYIFEISKDTVRLYKAMENDDRTLLIRGDLKYTLVKKQAAPAPARTN